MLLPSVSWHIFQLWRGPTEHPRISASPPLRALLFHLPRLPKTCQRPWCIISQPGGQKKGRQPTDGAGRSGSTHCLERRGSVFFFFFSLREKKGMEARPVSQKPGTQRRQTVVEMFKSEAIWAGLIFFHTHTHTCMSPLPVSFSFSLDTQLQYEDFGSDQSSSNLKENVLPTLKNLSVWIHHMVSVNQKRTSSSLVHGSELWPVLSYHWQSAITHSVLHWPPHFYLWRLTITRWSTFFIFGWSILLN